MFVVYYEDSDGSIKLKRTATYKASAIWWICQELNTDESDLEWDEDDEGRLFCILGDAQYVVEGVVHVY